MKEGRFWGGLENGGQDKKERGVVVKAILKVEKKT
jgi:hypothetical protein